LPESEKPLVDLREFGKYYPRYPGIETVNLRDEDKSKYLDLTYYMNLTPFIIQQNAPGDRVFRLFRTMGLRHLPVIDEKSRVVGMITRRDVVKLEDKTQSKRVPSHLLYTDRKGENDVELADFVEDDDKLLISDEISDSGRNTTPNLDNFSSRLSTLNASLDDESSFTTFTLFKLSLLISEEVNYKTVYDSLVIQYPSITWLYAGHDCILFCETERKDILTDDDFQWPEGVKQMISLDEIQITLQALVRLMSYGLPISKKFYEKIELVFKNRKKVDFIDLDVLESLEEIVKKKGEKD